MDILYNTSRATGRTKVWSVVVQGDMVIVKHGALDGKQVEHETICKAKKNKDAHQVAQDYAQSLWDKKRKIGYDTTQGALRQGFFPMLAQEYTPGQTIEIPCLVQPKLDGIRCLVYNGPDGLIFQSRNQTHFQDFPHLSQALVALFETNPEMVLDGELFRDDMDFQTITSIVRRKGHEDLLKIQYHVYDCILKDRYEDRYAFLQGLKVPKGPVVIVQSFPITRAAQIETYHTRFAEEGYEGIMIRNPYAAYQEQIRSKDLLKYKLFKEQEYEVIGHVEGKGGIPVFVCETNGKTFQVMVKSTMEDKKNSMDHVTSFYHQWLTVKYQELSKDGIPRFPVGIGFRDGT